jgi:lipoyl(octanoyl) transferase
MIFEDWGKVEYTEACERQLRLVEEVYQGGEDRLVFCTHPPVVTKGRGTTAEDMTGWDGSTIESSRGGRATYHGPSQIVIYPILNLTFPRTHLKERDIHAYLRALEETTAVALKEIGIDGERRETPPGALSLTGVWVGERKIASVGIAVRKWISYHGVAVNVLDDPNAHRGIKPCGFTPETMTSVEKELGRKVDPGAVKEVFRAVFTSCLS